MPRPREAAAILKLKGTFLKNPQRERQDAEGRGEFNLEPPEGLTGEEIAAWRYLVERLPKVALSASDEPAVLLAARTYAAWRSTHGYQASFKPLAQQLLATLSALGMTPQARTRLTTPPTAKVSRFEAIRDTPAD